MPWWFAVVESEHELQNPTSADKIRLLGNRLRLGPGSHVLDVASGKAGPAIVLAREFGCRITCVERAAEFHEEAVERVRAAGLERLIELVHGDAAAFPIEEGRWDAAMCLGASFVWGGLAGTLAAMTPAAAKPQAQIIIPSPTHSPARNGILNRVRNPACPTPSTPSVLTLFHARSTLLTSA